MAKSRSARRRKQRAKRHKREKNRLKKTIYHFTQCPPRSAEMTLWSINPVETERVVTTWVCKSCQLRYKSYPSTQEIEIKGLGRMHENVTVLDLLTL